MISRSRLSAGFLGAALLFAAATDYIPSFLDAEGRVFGLFQLNIYKDALHVASATWAIAAALISRPASIFFLRVFGTLYFLDGVMGTFTGSGFLDLSIFIEGMRPTSTYLKIASSLPHLALGAFGIVVGFSERRILP